MKYLRVFDLQLLGKLQIFFLLLLFPQMFLAYNGKLLQKPLNAYFIADDFNKRRLVKSLVDKFQWENENLSICWRKEIEIVANRNKNTTVSGDGLVGSATGNRTLIYWLKTNRPNH